jgi:hypothetical protein
MVVFSLNLTTCKRPLNPLSTGNKHAFHRIDGEMFDVFVIAWFAGAKMNNAMSKA